MNFYVGHFDGTWHEEKSVTAHPFKYDTESIGKILDELVFGFIEEFDCLGPPMVDEAFVRPMSWVPHLVKNIDKWLKSSNTMILISIVLKLLAFFYKLRQLLATCFYTKNVVLRIELVRLVIFSLVG
jgi:hypothetical protein